MNNFRDEAYIQYGWMDESCCWFVRSSNGSLFLMHHNWSWPTNGHTPISSLLSWLPFQPSIQQHCCCSAFWMFEMVACCLTTTTYYLLLYLCTPKCVNREKRIQRYKRIQHPTIELQSLIYAVYITIHIRYQFVDTHLNVFILSSISS